MQMQFDHESFSEKKATNGHHSDMPLLSGDVGVECQAMRPMLGVVSIRN
jgi:hypothetical protein